MFIFNLYPLGPIIKAVSETGTPSSCRLSLYFHYAYPHSKSTRQRSRRFLLFILLAEYHPKKSPHCCRIMGSAYFQVSRVEMLIMWLEIFRSNHCGMHISLGPKGLRSTFLLSHHHLSLNRKGRWGTTDDFATSFLHFSLFSTAFCDFANSRPVLSLMLSSHLFLCLPCLLPPCG